MERDQLLFMSNEQMKSSFLKKLVHVVLNDGREEEFVVGKLQLASYSNDESYSVVGFISNLGRSYLFSGIKEINIVSNML